VVAIEPQLYPFKNRYLQRNDLKLHYLDEGAGDPVVMVHGNPTWSFYYRNLVLALRVRCRCIVPDHIGCGLSDKPPVERYPYTLAARVDDLEALLDDRGLDENLTLVLHDWGGMIGMAYAARHPERIRRLVLLNTGAFPLPKSKRFPWPLWICRNTWIGRLLVLHANAFCRLAARECVKRRPLPKVVRDGYLAPYNSPQNRVAVLRFVQDIPLQPSDPSFPMVEQTAAALGRFAGIPAFIGWGAQDFVFDDHFLDEWKRRIPNAEVHRYADAGHYILEDAADELIPLIASFLDRHPVGAPRP
jgi:haloalkane dehalogenase